MITTIRTEVYETLTDEFAALVVFVDANGDRVSYVKKSFAEKHAAKLFAFNEAFKDHAVANFAKATFRSNPNAINYQRIA